MSRLTTTAAQPQDREAAVATEEPLPPEFLPAREVADLLRVSIGCIYSLVDRGLLPCLRIGIGRGTLRFTEDDVRSYLTQARKGRPNPSLKHIRPSS